MGSRETRLAKLSAVVVLFLFSVTPFLVKSTAVDPYLYTVVRSVVAAAVIALIIRRIPKPSWDRYNVICVMSAAVSNLCFIAACRYTDVSSAVAVTYSWPMLVPIIGWLCFRTKTKRRDLVLLGIGILGLALIFAEQWSKPLTFDLGKMMALGSGVTFGIYVCANSKVRGGAEMAFYASVASAILGVLAFACFGKQDGLDSWDWSAMALNGVANGVVMLFFNYSLAHWNASAVTVVVSAELAVSPMWAILFLRERPSSFVIAGIAIMLLTMFAALIRPETKESS